jgi:pimeloyl-ACP methyl ester carboxylesterase
MPSDPVETAQLVQPQKFLDAQQRVKETGLQDEIFWDAFMDYFSGVPARISPALRQEYFDMNRRVPEKNLIKLVARVADNAVTSQLLGSITQPVLLIWGTADPLLPAAAADRLAFYLKAAPISRVLLPDVGHYPPLEVPERFADITVTYLEQVLGSPNKQ